LQHTLTAGDESYDDNTYDEEASCDVVYRGRLDDDDPRERRLGEVTWSREAARLLISQMGVDVIRREAAEKRKVEKDVDEVVASIAMELLEEVGSENEALVVAGTVEYMVLRGCAACCS